MSNQIDLEPPTLDTISSVQFAPHSDFLAVSSWDKVFFSFILFISQYICMMLHREL